MTTFKIEMSEEVAKLAKETGDLNFERGYQEGHRRALTHGRPVIIDSNHFDFDPYQYEIVDHPEIGPVKIVVGFNMQYCWVMKFEKRLAEQNEAAKRMDAMSKAGENLVKATNTLIRVNRNKWFCFGFFCACLLNLALDALAKIP